MGGGGGYSTPFIPFESCKSITYPKLSLSLNNLEPKQGKDLIKSISQAVTEIREGLSKSLVPGKCNGNFLYSYFSQHCCGTNSSRAHIVQVHLHHDLAPRDSLPRALSLQMWKQECGKVKGPASGHGRVSGWGWQCHRHTLTPPHTDTTTH